MEKWEIWPPLPQKSRNQSSPSFAWVITSGTPTLCRILSRYYSINQSINKFISCHSTEARATVRLCQIKEKCLKTDLKCVNGWSSSTVQWKRLPPFTQICENAHQVVLPGAYSQDPCTNFYDQYVRWRGLAQGCAFWGSQKQNFTFRPCFPPPKKMQIFRQFSTGLRKLENFASKRP